MAVPDDDGRVLSAIRLGWAIAEVRGRNRPDAPPGAKAGLPGPPGLALPLHVEQTATELRISAQSLLMTLAGELSIDSGKNQPSYSRAIDGQARKLADARELAAGGASGPGGVAGAAAPAATGDPAPAGDPAAHDDPAAAGAAAGDPGELWGQLEYLIFRFDEHIQDALASGPDTIASGYQLGRALAEPYWALDPALDPGVKSPAAWWFLLGSERCGEMSRLAGRLSAYFHPYTAAAIAGSVQIWKHLAADPAWRKNADDALYRQTRRWYELVVMRQDPTTLVQPYALIRSFRMVARAVRIFWPELIGTAVAAAALSGFVVAVGEKNLSSFLKSALGFIAIAGFSLSGLLARLKNQAQAMVTRLRQDVYTDLVAVAITTAPPIPAVSKRPARQNAKKAKMVRERTITPVTPN